MKNLIDLLVGGNNWIWNGGLIVLVVISSFLCYKWYKKTHSRPLLSCLPGVFTSLGLLGTFLAISISLHSLGSKGPRNEENIGKSIEDLYLMGGNDIDIVAIIQNLIPAFTTSILGLIFAIISTIWVRYIFAKEDAKEDAKLENKTPEEYIREIVTNTNQQILLLEEQIQKSKEYNDKLNDNIINQSKILSDFIDGFVKRMDDIFARMQDNIQQQVQTFGEEQFTKATNLLISLAERMEATTEKIIKNQNQSVETILGQTNTKIVDINSSITRALENLTKEIKHSLEELGSHQSERLNSIITNYDTFASSLSEQLQQKYSDMLAKALSMNEHVSNHLSDSMEKVVTNISEQCEALSSAIASNVESLYNAYKFVKSLVAEIRQNYDQAVQSYGDAVNVAHRTNEATEKSITAMNYCLADVKETNEKIAEVIDMLTNRQDSIEQLVKQVNSVSATIVELQKLESTLNKIART